MSSSWIVRDDAKSLQIRRLGQPPVEANKVKLFIQPVPDDQGGGQVTCTRYHWWMMSQQFVGHGLEFRHV